MHTWEQCVLLILYRKQNVVLKRNSSKSCHCLQLYLYNISTKPLSPRVKSRGSIVFGSVEVLNLWNAVASYFQFSKCVEYVI